MSFQVESEHRDGYLFLAARGEITVDALLDLGRLIRERCDEEGHRGVVLDCQHIIGALNVATLFSASQDFLDIVGPLVRVAYINPPPHWNIADDQFCRNVSHNRGGALELFRNESDAAAWVETSTSGDAG